MCQGSRCCTTLASSTAWNMVRARRPSTVPRPSPRWPSIPISISTKWCSGLTRSGSSALPGSPGTRATSPTATLSLAQPLTTTWPGSAKGARLRPSMPCTTKTATTPPATRSGGWSRQRTPGLVRSTGSSSGHRSLTIPPAVPPFPIKRRARPSALRTVSGGRPWAPATRMCPVQVPVQALA